MTNAVNLANAAPSIDGSGGNLTITGSMVAGSSYAWRNRIINGAMVIDQRNAGASVTQSVAVVYTVDRWSCYGSAASKFTVQRNAGSVTPPAGYTNYLGVTSSSAYTVGASEFFFVQQVIEGNNISDLGWGASGAQTVTLSFWVRSSLTGTFGGTLSNDATNRVYPFTYTISAANTWEQKTVTVAGDTTGTWQTGTSGGIVVNFNMGAGASVSGTAGAWSGSTLRAPTGATSVVGTNGATWYITGVQLEVGSVATPFERRDIGRELIMCQRYAIVCGSCQTGASEATNRLNVFEKFPVTMRSAPTLSVRALTEAAYRFGAGDISTASPVLTDVNSGESGYFGLVSGFSGLSVNIPVVGRTPGLGYRNFILASAEL